MPPRQPSSFRRDRPCRGRGFKPGRMRAAAGAASRLSEFEGIFPLLHLWRGQPACGRRWRAGAAWRRYVPGREALFGRRAYLLSERKTLRRDRPCLLVWRCLPRPPDRQWRGLRPRFDFRRASDDAPAKLRAGHQSAQSPFADRPRQRSRSVCRQSDHGCFAEDRRGVRFPPKGTSRVKVEYIGPASLAGSDDEKLLATLRIDGPASIAGVEGGNRSLLAENAPYPIATADARSSASAAGEERSQPVTASSSHAGGRQIPLAASPAVRSGETSESRSARRIALSQIGVRSSYFKTCAIRDDRMI